MPKGLGKVADVNARMMRENRWEEYALWRTHLLREGVPASVVWRLCAHILPPQDGSRPETIVPAEYDPIITKYKGQLPPAPRRAVKRHREGYYDTQAGLADGIAHDETTVKFTEKVKAAKADWKGEWEELAAMIDPDKYAPEVEVVRWVFNNAGKKPAQIQVVDVPSLGALRYLEHVCSSPIHYADFVKTNWSKMLPDKKALEVESRFADEGRKSTRMLDEFLDSFESEMEIKS
jgi:hypothetical protein